MGTTTTPNLGLIKPDRDESIKPIGAFAGWAAQNALNMDALDAVFRNQSDTWTPTWTAYSSNPTIGSGGSISGKYLRIWPKFVVAWILLNVGTTGFIAGSGTYRFSLPFAMTPALTLANEISIGKAILRDATSALVSEAPAVCYDVANNNLFLRTEQGSASWSNTTPFTLAQSDRVSAFFCYLTDVA